jgi:hypothetical protein
MNSDRWSRIAPLSSFLFVALVIVSGIVGGTAPYFDEPGSKVLAFSNDHDSAVMAGAALFALAALFLIVFVTALHRTLRRAEGDGGGVGSTLGFGGALIATVGMLLFAGVSFTLGDAAQYLDPSSAVLLDALSEDLVVFALGVGVAALMIGSGGSILRTGALPRWLGWAAIVLGVIAPTPAFFAAAIGTFAWSLVVGVLLSRRAGATV